MTFHCPRYRFTSTKFSDLYELLKTEYMKSATILVPEKANAEQVGIAHCSEYVEKIANGSLDEKEQRRLGCVGVLCWQRDPLLL